MKQLFVIEGRLLGESPRQLTFYHNEVGPPPSYLFFCGQCGRVFGQTPVLLANGKTSPWQSWRRCCYRCDASALDGVPGSITLSWDSEYLAAFPDAVLQHEVLRHLDWYERKQST